MPSKIRNAASRRRGSRSQRKEPLAIVGIGLRLPGGARDASSFWKMLCDGTDAITEIPEDRWSITSFYDPRPNMPGQSHSKWGGFIEGNDLFDAAFFSVSPHEAESMDPQQRLLLETAWHAFEDSGEIPDRSAAANIGVYVGISYNEYARFAVSPVDHVYSVSQGSGAFDATGTALSISANRISHAFNFKGPSMAVDTACSSSLVAFNEACRAVWDGECEAVLVAGVNHIIDPSTWIAFCSLGALSPDGRCKAFDASADGFVRGEGVGAVVVKPLSAAIRDGNRIYASVLGTAVNQDGYTPAIAMPNRESQARLIRHTCDLAKLPPSQIDFVEAHGTGTGVGDPIEANALGDALGSAHSAGNPLLIGSVKTNIGHLESAAGIAGLIKAALCLHHRHLPPSLHFRDPNPAVDFEAQNLEVVTENIDLSGRNGDLLHASVNSFGFGGANAHAILESAPASTSPEIRIAPGSISGRQVLTLSARTSGALDQLATSYAESIRSRPEEFCQIAAATARKHAPHSERLTVVGDSSQSIAKKLDLVAEAESEEDFPAGSYLDTAVYPAETKPVFVFSGQGSQWAGMGRELYHSSDLFRASLDRSDAALRKISRGKFRLLEEIFAGKQKSRLGHTAVAQPAIFAIQVALADLWQAWGIRPAAVAGHSVGEVAAAHVAGALTFEDAIRVIYHRGSKMESARAGRMIAAEITPEQALEAIGSNGGGLSLAACNGPSSVSISGEPDAVEHLYELLRKRNVFCRFVPVDYAFHSDLMDPVRSRLVSSLSGLSPKRSSVPIYSTVTGKRLPGTRFNADYWWRNVRRTVRFSEAIENLAAEGHRLFIEINAHPVLQPSLVQCLGKADGDTFVIPSLRRDTSEADTLLGALAQLHNRGLSVGWPAIFGSLTGHVDLPLYPFDRKRYWRETPAWRLARLTPRPHPWLHVDIPSPRSEWMFFPDRREHPFLNDHVVSDRIVFPASGYIEMALAVAHTHFGDASRLVLEQVEFQRVLFIPREGPAPTLRAEFNIENGAFQILSTSDADRKTWTLHALGRIRPTEEATPLPLPDRISETRKRCPDPKDIAESYQLLEESGLRYGPLFRGLTEASFSANEGWSRIEIPEAVRGSAGGFLLHPVLLDSAFHVMALLPNKTPGTFLPVEIRRLRVYRTGIQSAWVHARLIRSTPAMYETEITLLDDKGGIIAELEGFRLLAVESARTDHLPDVKFDFLQEEWIETEVENDESPSADPESFFPPLSGITHLDQSDRHRIDSLHSEPLLYNAAVRSAFVRLGFDWQSGETFTLEALADRLGIPSRNLSLTLRSLRFLENDRLIHPIKSGERWRVADRFETEDTFDEIWRSLIERAPALSTELILLELITLRLPDILSGKTSLASVLEEKANSHLMGQFHGESAWIRPCHESVVDCLRPLIDSLPAGRRLSVLELGGADRRTAMNVLSQLPVARIDYRLTDSDPEKLAEAVDRLQIFPNVTNAVLNIRRALKSQPVEPNCADVVISAHQSPLSGAALRRVRQLLKPGGLFLQIQPKSDSPFLDFLAGLDSKKAPPSKAGRAIGLLKAAGFRKTAHRATRSRLGHRFLVGVEPGARTGRATESAGPGNRGEWLIFSDPSTRVSGAVSELLQAKGQKVRLISPDAFPANRAECVELLSKIKPSPPGIIYLGALEETISPDTSLDQLQAGSGLTTHLPLTIAQALDTLSNRHAQTVFCIGTRSAQNLPSDFPPPNLSQVPLAGLVRVIQSELRSRKVFHADFPAEICRPELDRFCRDLLSGNDETQIAYRGEARFIPRLRICAPHGQHRSEHLPLYENPAQLITRQAGIFDHLALQKLERIPPGKGEIEIEIHAAGLNFRDVMKALGVYPSDADDAGLFGDDLAGVITALGPGVRNLEVGDRVVGVRPGCFRTHLTLPAALVFPLPDRVSFQEAATIPSIYLTAWFALHELGNLRKGERVLIHAGAGGVGLAAIRLAQHAGAEIFATAGSPLKRDFLHKLGVEHVFDSRSLDFCDGILEATGGEGVDIVLNSLAGQAIPKSLECLREGGRFLELGKRDIYENNEIGLRPFKNCLTYIAIDLARQIAPARFKALVTKVRRMIEQDIIRPLPHTVFPINRAPDAFRHMAQGKHIGKIVFDFENQRAAPQSPLNRQPVSFSRDGTYLITGGTRGFGLVVASFLAESGAGHLVLASRSGRPMPDSESILEEIREKGAKVHLRACDIGSESDLAGLLGEIHEKLPPLRGVFHGAMVIQDEVLTRMTPGQLDDVCRPKVSGAWNLHRQTLHDPLDHFVLFSSISVLVGNPGQANYVAANAFLDSLAHYRRKLGMPGLSIAWDRLNESGYAARTSGLAEHFERMGWKGLTNSEALRGFGLLLQNNAAHMAVSKVDWSLWQTAAGLGAQAPRYEDLVSTGPAGGSGEDLAAQVRQQFFATTPDQRVKLVEGFIVEQVAKVLRISPNRLSRTKPLNEQGLDSLMAVELFGVLENQLGVPIPPSQLIENPTIEKAAASIARVLETQEGAPSVAPAPSDEGEDAVLSEQVTPEQDLITQTARLKSELNVTGSVSDGPPQEILLTGVTGFLGPHLLKAFLDQSGARLHCLVRARSKSEGLKRIRERLETAGVRITGKTLAARVIPIPGDLGESRIGFSEKVWDTLAGQIDTIVHAAASVNHAADYAEIRASDVLGTTELIRLAASSRTKRLHFLSSLAVFSAKNTTESTLRAENTEPDPLETLFNAYGQGKAISEALIRTAAAAGIPANIFRLGHLVSESEPGATASKQALWLVYRACLYLEFAPGYGANLQITPTAWAAGALARAVNEQIQPDTWHVASSHIVTFNDLLDHARRLGYRIDPLSRSDWVSRLGSLAESAQGALYASLFPDAKLADIPVSEAGVLDDRRFRSFLRSHSENLPKETWDDAGLVEQLKELGFLPDPGKGETNTAASQIAAT